MLQNSNIKTIFFDFDGTLADNYTAIHMCFEYAFKNLGLPVLDQKTIKNTVGESLKVTAEKLFGKELAPKAIELIESYYPSIMFDYLKTQKGAPWLLEELQEQGYQLAVFSNQPGHFVRKLTKHLDIDKYFNKVIGGKDHHAHKPSREFSQFALDEMKSCPNTSILIGDSIHDIDAAHSVGMPCLAVTTGSHSHEQLKNHPNSAHGIYNDLHHLAEEAFKLSPKTCLTGKS